MRLFKYGRFFKLLYPNRTWFLSPKRKVVYLTFDDGPVPEVTSFVLEELDKVGAKATFFVVGGNVKKHQEIYRQVLHKKHSIGNHTMNHVNGKYTRKQDYIENVLSCDSLIKGDNLRKLFRPPYGQLTRAQEKELKDYKVTMWSVLAYDFDDKLSAEECLDRLIKNTSAGSVVLLHDSIKTYKKLQFVLPKYLSHLKESGYKMEAL